MSDIPKYSNFVPQCVQSNKEELNLIFQSGIEAKRFYENVISSPTLKIGKLHNSTKRSSHSAETDSLNSENTCPDNELFLAAQKDDHKTLKACLKANPEKLNLTDDYGWSLLMIACQANAVNTVKLLLSLNIDKFIRDKAGNSANTILIKQKNTELINIFLNHKSPGTGRPYQKRYSGDSEYSKQSSICPSCKYKYYDKRVHMSSTVHNMSSSKEKEVTPQYTIPEFNRGFQILVKSGWNKEHGLGPSGSGKLYPVKPVLKQDKKGLGSKKAVISKVQDSKIVKQPTPIQLSGDKSFEMNFRRQFYD